jgi:hypothetical protein
MSRTKMHTIAEIYSSFVEKTKTQQSHLNLRLNEDHSHHFMRLNFRTKHSKNVSLCFHRQFAPNEPTNSTSLLSLNWLAYFVASSPRKLESCRQKGSKISFWHAVFYWSSLAQWCPLINYTLRLLQKPDAKYELIRVSEDNFQLPKVGLFLTL